MPTAHEVLFKFVSKTSLLELEHLKTFDRFAVKPGYLLGDHVHSAHMPVSQSLNPSEQCDRQHA